MLLCRCRSAHSETLGRGSGVSPSHQERESPSTPSNAAPDHDPGSAELRLNLGEFREVGADMSLQKRLHGVRIHAERRRHQRRCARGPVRPGIAFFTRQPEHERRCPRAIDQFTGRHSYGFSFKKKAAGGEDGGFSLGAILSSGLDVIDAPAVLSV